MINILSRGKKSDLLDSIVKGLCYLLYKYTFQLLQHPLRFDLTFFKKNKRSTSHVWRFKATDIETQTPSPEFLQLTAALKMTRRPRVTTCFPRFPTAHTLPLRNNPIRTDRRPPP